MVVLCLDGVVSFLVLVRNVWKIKKGVMFFCLCGYVEVVLRHGCVVSDMVLFLVVLCLNMWICPNVVCCNIDLSSYEVSNCVVLSLILQSNAKFVCAVCSN